MTGRWGRRRRRLVQGLVVVTLIPSALIVDSPTSGAAAIDEILGITERVSLDAGGRQTDADSDAPSISADGRFVAFESQDALVPLAENTNRDQIYLRDRLTGAVRLVSQGCRDEPVITGAEAAVVTCSAGNGQSNFPQISADGLKVVFESEADNLVFGPEGELLDATPFGNDIYLADFTPPPGSTELVEIPTITLVSVRDVERCSFDDPPVCSVVEEQFNGSAENPAMSADGTQVVFEVPFDDCIIVDFTVDAIGSPCVNHSTGVWIRNIAASSSVSVSDVFDSQGLIEGRAPNISADGRYVTFEEDINLIEGSSHLIFLYARDTDNDGLLDESNPEPDVCVSVCLEIASRHPDDPSRDVDLLLDTHSSEAAVEVDNRGTVAPDDDEVVVAYSFTDFDFPLPNFLAVSAEAVPLGLQLVVVSTFDPGQFLAPPECEIIEGSPLCEQVDTHITTVIASIAPDGTLGAGFGSGQPALSANARYLAFTVSDGALITLGPGQCLPAPQGTSEGCQPEQVEFCFPSSDSFSSDVAGVEIAAAESINIPCQVVLTDLEPVLHPVSPDPPALPILRPVSVGGDPRDPANPQISLADPAQLGADVECCPSGWGGSSAPTVSADGRAIAFESDANNLLGFDSIDVTTPFDSNDSTDIYVRELTPLLMADTSFLDFGTVQIDDPGTATITIANGTFNVDGVLIPGFGPVTIQPIDPLGGDFSIQPGDDGCSGVTLDGGETCEIVVTFTPTAPGSATATLTVTYPGPTGTLRVVSVELVGNGVLPVLTATPDPLSFGPVRINDPAGPATRTLTITNTGLADVFLPPDLPPHDVIADQADLSIAAVDLVGSTDFAISVNGCSSGTDEPFLLAVGASCPILFSFDPTSSGPKSAVFTLDFLGFELVNVDINGIGVGRPAGRPR